MQLGRNSLWFLLIISTSFDSTDDEKKSVAIFYSFTLVWVFCGGFWCHFYLRLILISFTNFAKHQAGNKKKGFLFFFSQPHFMVELRKRIKVWGLSAVLPGSNSKLNSASCA